METIDQYTIYCTVGQIEKAFNLGAKIDDIETAEEMIGWLEERGVYIDITNSCGATSQGGNYYLSSCEFNEHGYSDKKHPYPSRKEATLAAIDSALDYLSKNK